MALSQEAIDYTVHLSERQASGEGGNRFLSSDLSRAP